MPGENNTITWSLHGYVLPGCRRCARRLRPQRAGAACPEVFGAEAQVTRRLGRRAARRRTRRPPVPRLRRRARTQQVAVAERRRKRLGRHREQGRLAWRCDDAAVPIMRHRHGGIEHIVRHAAAVLPRGRRRSPRCVRTTRGTRVVRGCRRGALPRVRQRRVRIAGRAADAVRVLVPRRPRVARVVRRRVVAAHWHVVCIVQCVGERRHGCVARVARRRHNARPRKATGRCVGVYAEILRERRGDAPTAQMGRRVRQRACGKGKRRGHVHTPPLGRDALRRAPLALELLGGGVVVYVARCAAVRRAELRRGSDVVQPFARTRARLGRARRGACARRRRRRRRHRPGMGRRR